jgi:hypothetical protein
VAAVGYLRRGTGVEVKGTDVHGRLGAVDNQQFNVSQQRIHAAARISIAMKRMAFELSLD